MPLRWSRSIAPHLLPLLLGIAVTLVIRGYQYGGGNHSVYLIAPLREVHPELLANDWWTNKTLQYHVAFTKLTAGLMKLAIERPAFAAMYLALVVLMHLAWLRLVLVLGFDARVYLFSVLLYYLSAGGTGLGSYQFLQDSSFLPGNIANVAMLWGLVIWVAGKTWPAGIWLAIASLFHLNHAIVALGFWALASVLKWNRKSHATSLLTFVLILLLALPNIFPAAQLTLSHAPKLPLSEFVQLYVKLRHPHHYDPLSWPIALWVSFLWPLPLACIAWRRMGDRQTARRTAVVVVYLCTLMALALMFAGVFFISEPLIQMSLFRFSIYVKLLSCIGAAAVLLDPRWMERQSVRWALPGLPLLALIGLIAIRFGQSGAASAFVRENLTPLLLFIALLTAGVVYVSRRTPTRPAWAFAFIVPLIGVLLAAWWNWLGLRISTDDRSDADYLAMCTWVRQNTPTDATFLVPPNEQLFRFHARRAIVVNFKGVPQLSSELGEWRRRLEDVLDIPLTQLTRRFDQAHADIARRYDSLPAEHLGNVAREYGVRYIATSRAVAGLGRCVFENHSVRLYDLSQ